jgi:hypothetical protein
MLESAAMEMSSLDFEKESKAWTPEAVTPVLRPCPNSHRIYCPGSSLRQHCLLSLRSGKLLFEAVCRPCASLVLHTLRFSLFSRALLKPPFGDPTIVQCGEEWPGVQQLTSKIENMSAPLSRASLAALFRSTKDGTEIDQVPAYCSEPPSSGF